MKNLLWIAGGVIFVSSVFFIPGPQGNIWLSVVLSGLAALVYMIVISRLQLKKIGSQTVKIGITGTLTLLVIFSVVTGFVSYRNSIRESRNLISMQRSMESSYLRSYINEPLLETLRAYRNSVQDNSIVSLGSIFRSKYDSLIKKDSEFEYGSTRQNKTWHIYVAKDNADTVMLIGESTFLDGKNPDFHNYTGKTGLYQVKGVLTRKGLNYERTN